MSYMWRFRADKVIEQFWILDLGLSASISLSPRERARVREKPWVKKLLSSYLLP